MRRCLATVKSYRAKKNGKNDILQQLITTSITHQPKNRQKSWVRFKIFVPGTLTHFGTRTNSFHSLIQSSFSSFTCMVFGY